MSTPASGCDNTRPRIAVLGDAEQALRRLGDWQAIDAAADVTVHPHPLKGAALVQALQDAQVVVLVRDRTPFTAELLAQLPRLKYLIYTGTRNTTLDLQALAARQIPVSHTEWGPSKDSTCEMTWALILAARRQLVEQSAVLRSGQWRSATPQPLANVLQGQTLGLIGLGEIGSRVARIGLAFGMQVQTWSPNMTAERAAALGVQSVSLDQLLQTSHVVSLHLVPSETTRQLLNAERLAQMRPDSLLVNTSRSALIDTPALVQALQQGRPGLAALDVFDTEPLPAESLLRDLPNVLLTPHLGFVTEPVFQRFADGVVAHLQTWLSARALATPDAA
jgi:phosphoglycerate dehydrogenase-like enzyme